MTLDQYSTILDALEFKEYEFTKRLDREPKTRSGKPNPVRLDLRKELDKIADARHAFKNAGIKWTEEPDFTDEEKAKMKWDTQ